MNGRIAFRCNSSRLQILALEDLGTRLIRVNQTDDCSTFLRWCQYGSQFTHEHFFFKRRDLFGLARRAKRVSGTAYRCGICKLGKLGPESTTLSFIFINNNFWLRSLQPVRCLSSFMGEKIGLSAIDKLYLGEKRKRLFLQRLLVPCSFCIFLVPSNPLCLLNACSQFCLSISITQF